MALTCAAKPREKQVARVIGYSKFSLQSSTTVQPIGVLDADCHWGLICTLGILTPVFEQNKMLYKYAKVSDR